MRRGSFTSTAFRLLLAAALFGSLSCSSFLCAADPAPDQTLHPSKPAVKTELTEVITAQLAAFRANDYPKAYTFASSEIRDLFPLAEFETMVRNGFPVIAQSSTAAFGLALDAGDEAVVTVRVEGKTKNSVAYQYHLKKEAGHWRIAAVTEVKDEALVI